jgi:hypothetical protein
LSSDLAVEVQDAHVIQPLDELDLMATSMAMSMMLNRMAILTDRVTVWPSG